MLRNYSTRICDGFHDDSIVNTLRADRFRNKTIGAGFAWSRRRLTVASLILAVAASVGANGQDPQVGPPAPLTEGVWPSSTLMQSLLRRWANNVCDEFELDSSQSDNVERAMVDRWSTYLQENRPRLQPLFNEFVEMRMDINPPDKREVQDWAQRAAPELDRVHAQLNETAQDVRKVLRPMQRVKFEIQAAKFAAGMAIAEGKLRQWRAGDVGSDEMWEPTRAERRKRRAESAASVGVEKAPDVDPKDAIAKEVGEWEKFTKKFIEENGFDAPQRIAAQSCLSELSGRAMTHRDRRKDEIARLELHIERGSKRQEDVAAIESQLAELYGPIDEMFAELKSRLESFMTQPQRSAWRMRDESAKKTTQE